MDQDFSCSNIIAAIIFAELFAIKIPIVSGEPVADIW
jgi:hypothetical protein